MTLNGVVIFATERHPLLPTKLHYNDRKRLIYDI